MTENKSEDKRVLTGDRPTGKLHLGHYVGSLENRIKMSRQYDTFIIIADVQALTTNFDQPERLERDVLQAAEDYLAAGIDPEDVTICVQSMIPQIAELTVFYSMLVTVNQLERNPTVKAEAEQYNYEDMTYGFLGYPVSQAADITFCRANLVPVGEDQLPHLEQTRRIVRKFNNLYGEVFPVPEPKISDFSRLVGLDGKAKMSKSLNNAIFLSDSEAEVEDKVNQAVTDPSRIRIDDPGTPEDCTVFEYHRAFNEEEEVKDIKIRCRNGDIGCVACKEKLTVRINEFLQPMRERRVKYQNNPELIEEILYSGTERARQEAEKTMKRVRKTMKIDYLT